MIDFVERAHREQLDLAEIYEDLECQPRVDVDDRLVMDYADLLDGGDDFAQPIVVFRDPADGTYRLVDGFHRLRAHKVWCERHDHLIRIEAEVHAGDRHAAIEYAIGANAKHGKRRSTGDIRRAFDIAVRHKLVDPADARSVQTKIGCSLATAYGLVKPFKEKAHAARDKRIAEMTANGATQSTIASEVGVSQATISRSMQNSASGKTLSRRVGASERDYISRIPAKPETMSPYKRLDQILVSEAAGGMTLVEIGPTIADCFEFSGPPPRDVIARLRALGASHQ